METEEWAVERMAAAVGEQQKALDNSQHIQQGAAEAEYYGYAEGPASPLAAEEAEQKEVYTKFALGKMQAVVVVVAIL